MVEDPRLVALRKVLHRELWPDATLDRMPPAMAAEVRARAHAIAKACIAELDASPPTVSEAF